MILLYSSFCIQLNHGINKEGVFEMLTKIEIEKEKIKLMKSLLNISDGDLTFISVKTKIPYSRIWGTFHKQKLTDQTLKMINDSCYGDLLSDGLKEYINEKFGE
jgi:hypothetical protein